MKSSNFSQNPQLFFGSHLKYFDFFDILHFRKFSRHGSTARVKLHFSSRRLTSSSKYLAQSRVFEPGFRISIRKFCKGQALIEIEKDPWRASPADFGYHLKSMSSMKHVKTSVTWKNVTYKHVTYSHVNMLHLT